MESYVDFSGHAGFQDTAEDAGDRSSLHQPPYVKQPSASSMGDAQKTTYYNANGQPSMVCDIKPRLTKGQHEMLEAEYMKQNKPSTSTKKGFAEALGVSLDKVNNWFQNRRAKSKQDAKKAAGAYNLFHAQQQVNHLNLLSDSESSPAFPASDYFSMMQQCSADDKMSNGLGTSEVQHYSEQREFNGVPFSESHSLSEQSHNFAMPQQIPQEMFDSPQELNRRTLTQEQFDAFAHNAGSMSMPGTYDLFQSQFSGNQDVFNQVFPELQNGDLKQQHAYSYADHGKPPMSSHDSTVPSVLDQSMATFPSSSSIRDPSTMSSTSSDWAGSRSSSVSDVYHDDPLSRSYELEPPARTIVQWQPGQSVPVDVNALSEQFRQVAQARQPPHQFQAQEQPLAWPADDAYERRQSQISSMLAQSMSNVGLHTPHPQQHATFKSPAPPASIAARRQRPRPAALGIASMRSQSYSGAAQPGSSGQAQQHSLTPGQPQVRRIRSSNVLGGVAQGRVQKPMPGAPQRSPLAWSFSDAMNSPKAGRHLSTQPNGTLAPPTPLSPNEFPRHDQARAHPAWQSSGHVSRQPSISETDLEHGLPYVPAASAPSQNFSSPPHTPRYHQQGLVQQRVGSNVITENTPPQSAPVTQQCFPTNTFAMQNPPMQPQYQQSHASVQQVQAFAHPQQHQFMNVVVPEPQFQMPDNTMLQHQQPHGMTPVSSAPNGMPLKYAHGVPVVNAQGQLELMIPPQFMQQAHAQIPIAAPQQPHQTHTPPKSDQFESMVGMFSTAAPAPALHVTAQIPKQPPQSTEFFVHEYSPPADMKRAATPRKMVDTGPKTYSFANHGPEDFQKGKKSARAAVTASNSPASSTGASSS